MSASLIMNRLDGLVQETDLDSDVSKLHIGSGSHVLKSVPKLDLSKLRIDREEEKAEQKSEQTAQETTPPRHTHARQDSQSSPRKSQHNMPSPRRTPHTPTSNPTTATRSPLHHAQSTPARSSPIQEEPEFTDERARDITHGRLVQGHIVPDDYPSPTQSSMSSSMILERPEEDPMEMSRNSSFFNPEGHALGGTADATATSDEEEEGFNDPTLEQMITLVGDVRNRPVFIVDDMIDKAGSWIAAAECVVKRGGAKKVYIIATHGLFGGDSLEELQDCDCIDTVLVTNSFPISPEKARAAKKLVILDLSNLLAEAIRRNHYGESISALFTHTYD